MIPWHPRDLLGEARRKGIFPHKGLGQHFLIDKDVALRIVEAAGIREGDGVLEVGPGIGSLTFALAERARKVTAVEVDGRLADFLLEKAQGWGLHHVEVLKGDILKVDLGSLLLREGRLKVVANLPYNLSTKILFLLLEHSPRLQDLTLMFQREVAERIVSPPGGKSYGALSVMVRLWAEPRLVMKVPRGAFWPPPEVEGGVVHFKPYGARVRDPKAFQRVVEAAFAQRRKTLLNALSAGGFGPKERLRGVLWACGIEPSRRAETLSFEELKRISEAIS